MKSEHIHRWNRYQIVGDPADTWHRLCTVCGVEETYHEERVYYVSVDQKHLEWLEQQFAQVREQNTAMRALLEEMIGEHDLGLLEEASLYISALMPNQLSPADKTRWQEERYDWINRVRATLAKHLKSDELSSGLSSNPSYSNGETRLEQE